MFLILMMNILLKPLWVACMIKLTQNNHLDTLWIDIDYKKNLQIANTNTAHLQLPRRFVLSILIENLVIACLSSLSPLISFSFIFKIPNYCTTHHINNNFLLTDE